MLQVLHLVPAQPELGCHCWCPFLRRHATGSHAAQVKLHWLGVGGCLLQGLLDVAVLYRSSQQHLPKHSNLVHSAWLLQHWAACCVYQPGYHFAQCHGMVLDQHQMHLKLCSEALHDVHAGLGDCLLLDKLLLYVALVEQAQSL